MVLLVVDAADGEVDDEALQATTLARDVAQQVSEPLDAVAFGAEWEVEEAATVLGEYGVETVTHVSHDRMGEGAYAPEARARAVGQVADEVDPDAVVAPGTDRGAEILAHVAAKRDLPMVAECVEVTADGTYELVRQRWGGTLLEHARLTAETKLLTVAANEVSATTAPDAGEATIRPLEPAVEETDFEVELDELDMSDEEGVPLSEARVVIGGGRGTDGDFSALEELADRIPNAAVGSSRAAVNEGWRPHDDQVGQTGNKIAPEIYVACGISGAVQHMVGCKGAEHILAVNTDPEAAIIQKSDWAVIGDLHEVVPAVTEELDRRE